MKNSVRYILLVLVLIIVVAAVYFLQQKPQANPDVQDKVSTTTDSMIEDEPVVEPDAYLGEILSDSDSPVIDFNKKDYEKALAENRIIVLYFYANWCPICAAEVPKFYDAMEEINNENVIGFRANFNDDDTDSDEEDLAREFGVSYQHTKVILVDGERILKAPDSWDKEHYITEINKLLNQ
jgi:thiol-disulfide isomerase/thioredoxin